MTKITTEAAAQARMAEMKAELPSRADVYVSIYPDKCITSIYPNGLCGGDGHVMGEGPTVAAAMSDAWSQYLAHRAQYDRERTERMALAIIKATHEFGDCTTSRLRCEFGNDVDRLGDDAVALANDMGGSGPFALIDDTANANSEAVA